MSKETKGIVFKVIKWFWTEIHRGNALVIGGIAFGIWWMVPAVVTDMRNWMTANSQATGQVSMEVYELTQKLKVLEEKFNKRTNEMRTGVQLRIEI